MTAPRYARLASKLVVRESGPEVPPPSPEARERAIDAIARALAARAARRQVARWLSVGAAAALVVAAAVGVTRHVLRRDVPVAAATNPSRALQIVAHPVGSGASVVVSGSPAPLADGRQVGSGSRLVTPPNGQAKLAFSTGTTVTLGEGTDLTINDDEVKQELRLAGGWIGLHVAKLGPGQRFLVETADTEVEVRGTQFRVSLARPDPACGNGTPTRVAVTEGVVTVRHDGVESRVATGEQWPAGCVTSSVSAGATSHVAPAAQPRSTGAPLASTLAEQNDLFAEGVAAKQQGNPQAALATFDRFLAKYPTGALAESASVERMRLLRTSSPLRASAAARQYMASYPNGFAHGEAEAIVAGSP